MVTDVVFLSNHMHFYDCPEQHSCTCDDCLECSCDDPGNNCACDDCGCDDCGD